MSLILEARDLRAYYGGVQALFGIGFEVEEGGVTALLGANGAGKTTVLRALSAMIRREGEISFRGAPMRALACEDVARLGVAHVPDGRGTFTDLTVEENLRLGAYTRKDRGAVKGDFQRVFGYFPRLAERRGQQTSGHSLGRRAADAGDRARVTVAPEFVAARRAVVRPRAADRRRDLPHPARDQS
jgi:branched-chain amino acid transport system ATP-binding protein